MRLRIQKIKIFLAIFHVTVREDQSYPKTYPKTYPQSMYSRKCLRRLCGRRRSKKNLNNRKLCNTSSSSSSSFLRDPRDPSRLTLKRSGAAITIGRFSFRVLRFVFYASNLVLLISLSLSLSLSLNLSESLSLSLSLSLTF